MNIYFDTKDLISLFEILPLEEIDQFEEMLNRGNHNLVLSSINIIEISAPLLDKNAPTNVMRLLNRIEKMPCRFIAEAMITKLELIEAGKAFVTTREYEQISPFVNRFDETLSIDGPPPTSDYMSFGLAETVFTLWTEDPTLFENYPQHHEPLKEVFKKDRLISKKPKLRDHFTTTIERLITISELTPKFEDIAAFAKWIYSKHTRCPSIRLGYETHHKILKNIGDIPQKGDISDYAHISCTPYVDVITFDARMINYVKQASRDLVGSNYAKKICLNIDEVIERVGN
ncbi:hypothetical protein ACFL6N_03440 [Thermodesulfobacteriota bacterium]